MKFKICIVTGTRAEYGLLKPIIELFQKDSDYQVQLIVTCMHLSVEFGLTAKMIEEDDFPIADKIEMLLNSDTPAGISKSIGIGVMSFADSLQRLEPDILLVLGDRFETLSAVIPAYMMKIPVVHLYGGETTEGAFDEGIRHAITKMSYLHFTSTEAYRQRVIQLGEAPERVFNVGAVGVENIRKLKLIPKDHLETLLGFTFQEKNIIVTFHPATLEQESAHLQFSNLLSVLNEYPELGIIFTKANADPKGKVINTMINDFVLQNAQRAKSFISLGHEIYLNTMHYMNAVVGNSSSGIIEAPSLKVASINIGHRQSGRVKAKSIIDCDTNFASIHRAFQTLFSLPFQARLKHFANPYEGINTSEQIYQCIKNHTFASFSLQKKFYDIQFGT